MNDIYYAAFGGLILAIALLYIDAIYKNTEIANLKNQVTDCNLSIQKQNQAIVSENNAKINVQSKVNDAVKTNKKINKTIESEKKTVTNTKDLSDCAAATQWGANQARTATSQFY